MEKFLNDMLENAAELCDEQEFSEAIKIYDKIVMDLVKLCGPQHAE